MVLSYGSGYESKAIVIVSVNASKNERPQDKVKEALI